MMVRRTALVMVAVVTAGLFWATGSASAGGPIPTETKVVCSPRSAPSPPNTELGCAAIVVDADPGVDVDPAGQVEFFADFINTPFLIATCDLLPMGGAGGISACAVPTLGVTPVLHTIWAVYRPIATPYAASQNNDDVGNPSVGPPDPTDTRVLCAPATAPGPGVALNCGAAVGDNDSDIGPALKGRADFSHLGPGIGSCKLVILAPGLSMCRKTTSAIPTGTSTIDATFVPGNAAYLASSDSDSVTV